MKSKILIGFLVLLVSIIMLTSNGLASTFPGPWLNQATLSLVDNNPSQDPENSGFGMTQVVVWEEWNGNDWDIWMKYSLLNGALGSWIFPPVQPATLAGVDETNPAVTISNVDPFGNTWIHVVYQRQIPGVGQWDVCHTYTLNFGAVWLAPVVLDMNQAQDATDPAIVYTEDTSTPNGVTAMLAQIVWSEFNPGTGIYEIKYDAFYLDTNVPFPTPILGYVGPFTIRAGGVGGAAGNCLYPEIASVDEYFTGGTCSFDFSVVWQELSAGGQWNIWYDDGTTQTTGLGGITTGLTPGSTGQLNLNPAGSGNSEHPDIAATQNYLGNPNQQYYYHVDWVYNDITVNPNTWQIDNCHAPPIAPNPGAAAFIPDPVAHVNTIFLDNPTIASKLIAVAPFTVFETWMAWEDWTIPGATNPDIWCNVGTYSIATGFIMPGPGPGRVGYLPPSGGGSTEYNPEFWNRNDAAGGFPALTHLVFDQTITGTEVEYIDP
jgi:hypothetical protein